MFIGQAHGGVLAVPHQRRRDHRLAIAAKVAPVIGFIVIDDHAIGKPRRTERPGNVKLAAAAVEAAAPAFHVGMLLQLGLLVIMLIIPPGSPMPYSIEAGPLSTSTRSVVGVSCAPAPSARRRAEWSRRGCRRSRVS